MFADRLMVPSLNMFNMQYMIYKDIKQRFDGRLWVDVISKSDLIQDSPVALITEEVNADDYEMSLYRKMGPAGALRVSVKSEEGLSEVTILYYMFGYISVKLKMHTFPQNFGAIIKSVLYPCAIQ